MPNWWKRQLSPSFRRRQKTELFTTALIISTTLVTNCESGRKLTCSIHHHHHHHYQRGRSEQSDSKQPLIDGWPAQERIVRWLRVITCQSVTGRKRVVQLPPTLNSSALGNLSKILHLVGKFSFKNVKFDAEKFPFWETWGKFRLWAPIVMIVSCIWNLRPSFGILREICGVSENCYILLRLLFFNLPRCCV